MVYQGCTFLSAYAKDRASFRRPVQTFKQVFSASCYSASLIQNNPEYPPAPTASSVQILSNFTHPLTELKHCITDVTFEVFTAVTMKNVVLWDI
jgi:hypothetical protein